MLFDLSDRLKPAGCSVLAAKEVAWVVSFLKWAGEPLFALSHKFTLLWS
jgi:hypothetical protein